MLSKSQGIFQPFYLSHVFSFNPFVQKSISSVFNVLKVLTLLRTLRQNTGEQSNQLFKNRKFGGKQERKRPDWEKE